MPSFFREGAGMRARCWRTTGGATDDMMARVGLRQLIRETVEQSFERWEGAALPRGQGSGDSGTSRLVNLADVVEVFYRAGGVDAAVTVARERAGTQFDPGSRRIFATPH